MTVCGEKVTGVCVAGKCQHIKRCCPVVWDKYGKIKPQTNEEWLRSCNTEQLAELLYDIRYDYQIPWKNKGVVEWLKQPHDEKE